MIERPTAREYISGMIDEFTEMHGDRRFGDDPAIVAGIGFLDDMPLTVIGIEKGRSIEERLACSFGCASPEGYRKALRQMKLAEKFGRPVLCIVDTQGAGCGIGAEERGEGQAIAENLYEMMTLRTPILTLIIGEGGSGGALALSVADEVWMLENAYYSVVTPEACASILYKDAKQAEYVAPYLHLCAEDLLGMEIIERIIPECENFRRDDERNEFIKRLKKEVSSKLKELAGRSEQELLAARYEKFRKIGRQKRDNNEA